LIEERVKKDRERGKIRIHRGENKEEKKEE
jgi:hypothetical protein